MAINGYERYSEETRSRIEQLREALNANANAKVELSPEVNRDQNRLLELREYRDHMIKHIDWCRRMEDWHGVSDAANDLRETDCEIRCLADG